MQETIAAVILAGGQGRRLGGADKALLPLAGRPLLAHVLGRLAPQAKHILLSANGDPARFAPFGLPVVADTVPDRGPLGGIAAAAAECRRRWPAVSFLATVPVDMPLLPSDLIETLAETATATRAAVASAGGRTHWAAALWPLDAALALAERMERGGLRRLQDGLEAAGCQLVPFAAADAFANVNREEDLAAVARLLSDS